MDDNSKNGAGKNELPKGYDLFSMLEPAVGNSASANFNAPGNMDSLMTRFINHRRQQAAEEDSGQSSGIGQYCFVFEDEDDKCPYVPWGNADNEPYLIKREIMYSGQAGVIVQRLANMLTKQGVWHEVELPPDYDISEAEQRRINETIAIAKQVYARLGLYNEGIAKDENGDYTDMQQDNAVVEMVNNLLLANLAPVLISSKRKSVDLTATDTTIPDRNFWEITSVVAVPSDVFRIGKQEFTHTTSGGLRRHSPFVYLLPKPTFTRQDETPQTGTALQVLTNRKKYPHHIAKTPTFNPNKFTLDAQGGKKPVPGVQLIECWTVKMEGVFDAGVYPVPMHSLGSFRNYRQLDYQLSLMLHNSIVRGQHIRGIVRVYDIAYSNLDSYIETGADILQSLQNRWKKDRDQIMKIFTGTGNAGSIVVLPGMVPADAPQKHGTIEFTPVSATFDTSLIDAAYATVKLELLSAFGIIDPRIVGVQLGKTGNLSDQSGLLEIAMEITKEFLESYVLVVNRFLAAFNEIAGITHTDAAGTTFRVISGISIDTPYLKLFSKEMIELMKLAAMHPNEVRTMLGMDIKPDEELSANLTLQWQQVKNGTPA